MTISSRSLAEPVARRARGSGASCAAGCGIFTRAAAAGERRSVQQGGAAGGRAEEGGGATRSQSKGPGASHRALREAAAGAAVGGRGADGADADSLVVGGRLRDLLAPVRANDAVAMN